LSNSLLNEQTYKADCPKCFGLCCVALPYAKSADFAFNKDGGTPCNNLQADFRCRIHSNLRNEGFKGCTVYECFGAGQKVSQVTLNGRNWQDHPDVAKEMFEVFPKTQQLHEMLYYLNEAISLKVARPLLNELKQIMRETEQLTEQSPEYILNLDIPSHRAVVSDLLLEVSQLVREKGRITKNERKTKGGDLLGANLRGKDLRGSFLRGALVIAADLRNADLRWTDFLGADLRDADLSGANLTGSVFLTQAQVSAARGDCHTKLPTHLTIPQHWMVVNKKGEITSFFYGANPLSDENETYYSFKT